MAERRFAALAELRKRPAAETTSSESTLEPATVPVADLPPPPVPVVAPVPQSVIPPIAEQEIGKGRGRPPGKRSDPDWKPRTILMRTKTHRRVSGLLLEQDDGPDLSELIDQLLTDWISMQS